MSKYTLLPEEIPYLRELAKKQLDYAKRPIMREREALWYAHNDLKPSRPMIFIESDTFWDDMKPKARCTSALGQEMESQMLKEIAQAELIDDDKIINDFYEVCFFAETEKFGVEQRKTRASEGVGFHIEPVLEDLEEDLDKLSDTVFTYDKEDIEAKCNAIREAIGDILPIKVVNACNRWDMSVPQCVVELMGMENMFVSMISTPDEFHQLMNFVTEDRIRMLRWAEEQNCLFLNGGNDYMGSGNICFSNDIPGPDFTGKVTSRHIWGHENSQETVGVSPAMFKEFILPYMKRIADEFAMIYYGCCEPVSDFWEGGIEEIKNIRKISISPWCNEEFMAERLAGSKTIYSRKPSPNFLGIQKEFDEDAFRSYIRKTAQLTKNCQTEYIFRDIYTLNGNIEKVKKAVEIVRQETEI